MLYLGLLAADVTLSLRSRGRARQQSRNLAVSFQGGWPRLKPTTIRARVTLTTIPAHAESLDPSCRFGIRWFRPPASVIGMFLDPELVHAGKNNRILYLKTVPMIEVSHSFVAGESPSEVLENMTREVETKKL